jgi:hypothetical protein
MRKLYVGIDLGCKTCAGAVRDSKGKLLETCGFPTSAENLIDFVGKQKGEVRVLVEECELAGEKKLYLRGTPPSPRPTSTNTWRITASSMPSGSRPTPTSTGG